MEATRGAILARGQQGIPLLLEQLRSPDERLFQIALSTAREFPGSEVDHALATELTGTTPKRAALIVHAMADREDTAVLPAILNAAAQGPKEVRAAAIAAIGRVGDDSCLATLFEIALDADRELADLAKANLAILPSAVADERIRSLLSNAKGKRLPLLIELVELRRIDALPSLLLELDNSDQAVRHATLTALGETVPLERLSILITQVVASTDPEDATVAQKALTAASIRMPDREACAAELVSAFRHTTSVPTKLVLLQVLGEVGGPTALATIGNAAQSTDPQFQDLSTRLLGEWMTADAAPVLLKLAKTTQEEKYQVRALRGYLRIARQFDIPEPQRTEMCRSALHASQRTAEQKIVLSILERYPNRGNFELAAEAMQIAAIKEEATQTALAIAKRL